MYLYEGSQENELQQYKISEKLWSSISAAFERAAKYIHAKGGYKAEYLTDKEVKPLIDKTYEAFSEAVDYGLKDNEIPASMRLYLQDNVFVFSGFKAHTELRQASALLRDASEQIKPFNRFLTDIQKIDKDYNKTYLQAEYNFAVASSQAAARWQEIAADGDDFLLQYRTAKDERVREQHRLLDGITLPPSDKFWDEFFPPNGWNCRCYAVQVNPKRYPESNSEEAIQRGRAATYQPNAKGQNKAQIFRFNPGKDKKIFPPKHPYYKAKQEVTDVVTDMEVIFPTEKGLVVYQRQGDQELTNNIQTAEFLANTFGWKLYLKKDLNQTNKKTADAINMSLGIEQELKINTKANATSLQSELRVGSKQANYIIIRFADFLSFDKSKKQFIKNEVYRNFGRYSRIEDVMLIYPDGGYELLTRKQFEEMSKESK